MVIEGADALVAKLAVHGGLLHVGLADPAVLGRPVPHGGLGLPLPYGLPRLPPVVQSEHGIDGIDRAAPVGIEHRQAPHGQE